MTNISFGLSGKTICVTGGASGIGKAAVDMLAQEKARVVLLDFNEANVASTARELAALGVYASAHVVDVRDGAAMEAAVARAEKDLGPIDGLLACAGSSGAGRAETLSEKEWTDVLTINGLGTLITCQVVGRRMIERYRGSIVGIGSLDGVGGHPGRAHYVAAKFAVTGLLKNLALEWGQHGIRVNCIAPSFVDTPLMRKGVPPSYLEKVVIDRTPLGRIARPEEVAAAALMLLSDAASYLSGIVLPVDGGLSAGWLTRSQGDDLSSNRLLEANIYRERS